jgi:hypothetical protein
MSKAPKGIETMIKMIRPAVPTLATMNSSRLLYKALRRRKLKLFQQKRKHYNPELAAL